MLISYLKRGSQIDVDNGSYLKRGSQIDVDNRSYLERGSQIDVDPYLKWGCQIDVTIKIFFIDFHIHLCKIQYSISLS